ncbi:MAG TPA: 50S ribosomal protein L4 [Planctomycetota bacterium]
MADLPLYSKDGKSAGTVKVDEKLFGDLVRKKLLKQVVVIHEANQREGNAHTKTRGEVEGSTKKLWPQKHTGRARMGTKRSPIWVKGGIVFGPRRRDYRMVITDSMRRAALDSALLGKILDKEVSVVETLSFEKPKTKAMSGLIKSIGLKRSVLLAVGNKPEPNVWLSSRNIQALSVRPVRELNAYDIIKHKDLLLTKDALDALVSARSGTDKKAVGEKKK